VHKKQDDWHPSQIARPVEWEMCNGWPPDPLAVIRRIERPNGNVPLVRYRAVTWAAKSTGRELIGYYETGDDAAKAGWEHFHGRHAFCQHV
jgi:hypothetical protein